MKFGTQMAATVEKKSTNGGNQVVDDFSEIGSMRHKVLFDNSNKDLSQSLRKITSVNNYTESELMSSI